MKHIQAQTCTGGRTRLLIADDHDLARAGLCSLLQDEPNLEIVGEASDGQEALQLCHEIQLDVALLDVRMPVMDGLATTRAIKQHHPTIKVMIVTMHEDPDYLLEAVKAGAVGYVLKDAPRREYLNALRTVIRGETFLNNVLMVQALHRLTNTPIHAVPPVAETLTPREIDVLQHLTTGETNRQIAQHLMISPGTVKVHVERIIAKMGVSDRTQAAVQAIERKLF